MAAPGDLAAIEARLQAILDPYRDRLEEGPIYGRVFLRRPGAKAHDWFAGVVVATAHVSFYMLPVHTYPRLLDCITDGLRKRKKGASTFNFSTIEDALFDELAALTERGFEAYMTKGGSIEPAGRAAETEVGGR
jgi:hypothetical protein